MSHDIGFRFICPFPTLNFFCKYPMSATFHSSKINTYLMWNYWKTKTKNTLLYIIEAIEFWIFLFFFLEFWNSLIRTFKHSLQLYNSNAQHRLYVFLNDRTFIYMNYWTEEINFSFSIMSWGRGTLNLSLKAFLLYRWMFGAFLIVILLIRTGNSCVLGWYRVDMLRLNTNTIC